MTTQQLDNVHKAKPFRPFTVHMGDGRSFHVPHPEFLSRSPTGRTIIVYGNDDSFSVLDLLLLTELEVHPPSAKPGEAAAWCSERNHFRADSNPAIELLSWPVPGQTSHARP